MVERKFVIAPGVRRSSRRWLAASDLRAVITVAAVSLALASCGGGRDAAGADRVAGQRLFTSAGCAGCHTLKAAAATGSAGPDLDQLHPSPPQVLSQLKSPRGLMPRYDGKLSDREMRDIAAFVGARGGATGVAVAAPFKPDGRRLGGCAAGDRACVEQAFGNLSYNEGPKVALALLARRQTTDAGVAADCHRIAHRMGSAALVRDAGRVAEAFIAGSPICASGYYHGIIERAFLGQPPNKITRIAGSLCGDPRLSANRFLMFQCLHGLGHGLMIYSGYDLPGALRTCSGLAGSYAQHSCGGGVFMENFTSSYGVTSRYLRADDPSYPCDRTAATWKADCYQLVTTNLLRVSGGDQHKTAAGCAKSEPAWVSMCFESFGRDVSGLAGRSATKARASCRLAGAHEADCLYGVVREIINSDAGTDRGARFCNQLVADRRPRCFSGIGTVVAALQPTPVAVRRACDAITRRYAPSCARGAGLPATRR